MKEISRRAFLKQGSAAAGVAALPISRQTGKGPFDVALIGTGWWGMNILRTALETREVRVVGLCDVDERFARASASEVEQMTGDRPPRYEDYRELLHSQKPQIVIVATPDHWHALTAIAAIEAGAHVYLEKPVSHTIKEGSAILAAARRHDRVVQIGTHRRVSPHNISAIELLRSGRLGRIGMVRAFVHYQGGPGQPVADTEPPPELNWDMWCGPAPLRSYNTAIHPKGFRQFLDFANGQLGDWGIHWLDQILWWTEEKYPLEVYSTGGRAVKQDHTDAPDHQVATFRFESFTATWEHRLFGGNAAEKHNVGCYFYGTEGTLHLGWLDGWTLYPRQEGEAEIHQSARLHEPDHQNIPELWADFIASIREKRRPVCDIEIGHRSTTMSLLGMLSLKLGRSVRWDGEKEQIPGDEEANQLLSRPYRSPWQYPKA